LTTIHYILVFNAFNFEAINKNLFAIEKKIKCANSVQDQADVIKQVIAKELTPLTQTLVTTLKDVQTNHNIFALSIENRVKALEEKSKALYAPTSDLGVDHDKAIHMYQQGYTAEEIAKELRTTIGSVEFVLKLRDKER
jgi:DNA-binding NarL/FixJ family response regulator